MLIIFAIVVKTITAWAFSIDSDFQSVAKEWWMVFAGRLASQAIPKAASSRPAAFSNIFFISPLNMGLPAFAALPVFIPRL